MVKDIPYNGICIRYFTNDEMTIKDACRFFLQERRFFNK